MSHSPEPWCEHPDKAASAIVDKDGRAVVYINRDHAVPSDDNIERIVACVNFCQGFDTASLLDAERTRELLKIPVASVAYCKKLLENLGYTVTEPAAKT